MKRKKRRGDIEEINCLFDLFTCAANDEYGTRSAFPVKRKEYKNQVMTVKIGLLCQY